MENIKSIKEISFSDENIETIAAFHAANGYFYRTSKSFKWLYFNALNPKSILLSIKKESNILATNGMIFYKLILNGDFYFSYKSEATLIHEKYRNKISILDIYLNLVGKIRLQNGDIAWGISSSKMLNRLFYDKIKHQKPITFSFFSKNPFSVINFFLQENKNIYYKTGIYFLSILCYLHSEIRFSIFYKHYTLYYKTKLDNENDLTDFVYRFSLVKSDYFFLSYSDNLFKWRYQENILFDFEPLYYYDEENKLIGYIHLLKNKDIIEITDFVFEEIKTLEIALNQLLGLKKYKKCFFYYHWNNLNKLSSDFNKIFTRYGFWNHKLKCDLGFKKVSSKFNNIKLCTKNFYFCSAWMEGL